MVALQRFEQARPAQRLGVEALGRNEQDREVGRVRRREVLLADRPRLDAKAHLDRPRRALDAGGVGALVRLDQALVVLARELAVDRQPHRLVAAAARELDRVVDALVRCPESSRRSCRTAPARTPARASAPSWTSPKVPRVLTLLSTRLSEPTSLASFCISPMPRWTCSSRSATWRKLSPRRCSSVACSFSSTVGADLLELLLVVGLDRARACVSTVALTSAMRWSLARTSALQLLAERFGEFLQRRRLAQALRALRRVERLAREARLLDLGAVVAWPSESARCCCIAASWRLKLSICSFCVRAVSFCCASSVRWNSAERRAELLARALGAALDLVAQLARLALGARIDRRPAQRDPESDDDEKCEKRRNQPVEMHARLSQRARCARPSRARRRAQRGAAAARPSARRDRTRPARAARARPPAARRRA